MPPMTPSMPWPDYVPAVKYPRTPGYRPEGEENKYNAWYVKTDDQGRAERQARRQEDRAEGQCLPRRRADDERRLDARGLHARYRCDHRHAHPRRRRHHHRQDALRVFLLLRRQPHQRGRPGPQSAQDGLFGRRLVIRQRASWSRLGEADMAIGGDQGGSIRIPASFCGIYGMKGTHGLVPYTGVMPIELTLDHTGPMTRNVRDNALLLEVLAGADGARSAADRAEGRRTTPKRSAAASGACASASSRKVSGIASFRSRRRRQGHGGRRSFSRSSAPPSTRSRCRCIWWRRRSGCRSRPKAPPSS